MSTIIDELVVELKLDPKQFDQATKDQVGKLRTFEREHERHSKKMAKDTDSVTQAFSLLQGRLLAIAGLFMGGMGISQFTEHITKLTVQTGLLAQSLGLSTTEITKWQGVGSTIGASPGEMAQAIASVRNAQSDLRNGVPSGMQKFSYMTHNNPGPAVDLKPDTDPTEFMISVSRWLEFQKKQGPQAFAAGNRAVSTMLGFGQGTINALDLGPEELRKRLKEMEKFGPTPEQVKRFKELQEAFGHLEQSSLALGRAFVDKLQPTILMIINLLDRLTKWLTPADDAKVKAFTDEKLPEMGGSKSIFGRIKKWWNGDKGGATAPSEPGAVGGGTPSATGDATATRSPPTAGGNDAAPSAARARAAAAKGYMMDQLRKEGVPEGNLNAAASMLAGQAIAESNLRPNLTHDSGTGYGIYGARLDRRDRMFQWLKANGYARNSLEGQSRYMAIEAMHGSAYKASRNALMGASSENMAHGTRVLTRNFESPLVDNSGYRYNAARGVFAIPVTKGANDNAPAGSLDTLSSARLGKLSGAGAALRTGGGTVNNTRSTATHIGEMNVTVPPGADPAGYARGISQELQRYDHVMKANEGLL